jgi:hypothetical protein
MSGRKKGESWSVPVTKDVLVAILAVTVCASGERHGLQMPSYPDEFFERIEEWLNDAQALMPKGKHDE